MFQYLLLEWTSLASATMSKPSSRADPVTDPDNPISTLRNRKETIRQFVIYAENKVGWLNDFLEMLMAEDIHVMAISVLDTTDSAVIRLIPNYPKETARLLNRGP